MSKVVHIRRRATVRLTIADEQQFAAGLEAWEAKEGSFLPDEQRGADTYLKAIAVQVERGERPNVAGLLYRVETQDLMIR